MTLIQSNALLDVNVRVQPSATGVLMQSTFYRVCKLLIHYGSFILQDLSNRYVTRKIDMCVVVGLIKYHQINVSLEMSWIIQQLYSFWHIFLQHTYLFTVFIWVIDIFLYYLVIFLQIHQHHHQQQELQQPQYRLLMWEVIILKILNMNMITSEYFGY